MVTTYILQQRNILEFITIKNTNYQCSGLFQGQGQGCLNYSITLMYAHVYHIAIIIGMELKLRLVLSLLEFYIFRQASNNCVPSNSNSNFYLPNFQIVFSNLIYVLEICVYKVWYMCIQLYITVHWLLWYCMYRDVESHW